MRSPQPTSSIEPTETKWENPTFILWLQSSTALQSAPLWLMNATLPGRAAVDAIRRVEPGGRAHHAQGVRADDAKAAASGIGEDRASRASPSGPVSRNPLETMMAVGTPAATQSAITPGTAGAGDGDHREVDRLGQSIQSMGRRGCRGRWSGPS